ncbi:hypothetical protein OH77DRAFT_1417620 [Trametes cingulata]|nr:hypothetical protein OH77DRAFT_1417620 [Trametes cingulata]
MSSLRVPVPVPSCSFFNPPLFQVGQRSVQMLSRVSGSSTDRRGFSELDLMLRRCLRRSLSCDEVAESHYVDQGPFRVQMK